MGWNILPAPYTDGTHMAIQIESRVRSKAHEVAVKIVAHAAQASMSSEREGTVRRQNCIDGARVRCILLRGKRGVWAGRGQATSPLLWTQQVTRLALPTTLGAKFYPHSHSGRLLTNLLGLGKIGLDGKTMVNKVRY